MFFKVERELGKYGTVPKPQDWVSEWQLRHDRYKGLCSRFQPIVTRIEENGVPGFKVGHGEFVDVKTTQIQFEPSVEELTQACVYFQRILNMLEVREYPDLNVHITYTSRKGGPRQFLAKIFPLGDGDRYGVEIPSSGRLRLTKGRDFVEEGPIAESLSGLESELSVKTEMISDFIFWLKGVVDSRIRGNATEDTP